MHEQNVEITLAFMAGRTKRVGRKERKGEGRQSARIGEGNPRAAGKGFTVRQTRIRARRASFSHLSSFLPRERPAGIRHAITRRIKIHRSEDEERAREDEKRMKREKFQRKGCCDGEGWSETKVVQSTPWFVFIFLKKTRSRRHDREERTRGREKSCSPVSLKDYPAGLLTHDVDGNSLTLVDHVPLYALPAGPRHHRQA